MNAPPHRMETQDVSTPESASAEQLVLYLDMNVWIKLAQGVAGKSREWEARFGRLEQAVRSGKVLIPLSSAHYMELWNRGKEASRTDVARIMASLSSYATLRALHEVQTLEIRAEIDRRLTGIDNPVGREKVIGVGVNHAFASEHGRLRFVSYAATETSSEGPGTEPPEGWENFQRSDQWEWIQLAGVQQLFDSRGFDRTPEHRLGAEFADEENTLRLQWSQDQEMWKMRSDVVLRQEFMRILEIVNDVAAEKGLDPRSFFLFDGPVVARRDDTLSFLKNVPTAWVIAKLRDWKHRDINLTWHQHDRVDLISLALALPYCDIVITEKLWSHLANVSKLSEELGTSVYPASKMDQVLNYLNI